MKLLFWCAFAGILYTYLGYPLLMYALSCIRPAPWRRETICPSVSIVLAVHNGVLLLPQKIQHLLSLDYPNIQQIIIVSDGSTDGTSELLSATHHPLLKTVILKEHQGKAVAVNAGTAAATGDVIVYVDIRPEIAVGAIQKLVNNFADPQVGCVTGQLLLRRDGASSVSGAVGGLYWHYEQWIRQCESAFSSPVGVYGGFYAIRRTLAAVHPPGIILDDMFQPLSIIRKGFRSVLESDAIVFDTWPERIGAEFHRKVRTLAGNFQLFRLAPWTLTPHNRVLFQLLSHKVSRLIAPYLMVLMLISAVIIGSKSPGYALVAGVQILGLVLALVGLRSRISWLRPLCAPGSALLVLNIAAAVGLYKFLTMGGGLWTIWNSGQKVEEVLSPETARLWADNLTEMAGATKAHPLQEDSHQQVGA